MMLIDFDEKFREFLTEYKKRNKTEEDELEELIPKMYIKWLDSPKEWLSGVSPKKYFETFDAAGLIETLGKHIISDISVPGMLLGRIADTKNETYPYLISLLKNYEGEKSGQIKTLIVNLIEEMDMPHPYDYYIEVIAASKETGDFPEACAKELKNSKDAYKEKVITAYESAKSDYSSDCFLDILTDLPYDERTYNYALEKFLYNDGHKAFYASCLGKIGNEKSLPFLEEALKDDNISYFEYVSIKNASEELGSEANIERDFEGDKDYESLKHGGLT